MAATCFAVLLCHAAAQERVDFARDVRPVFEERCLSCHGPKKDEADLRLDRRDNVLREHRDDRVIVPGDAEGSALYHRISLPAGDPDVMPAEGDPLTPEQIGAIRAWIEQGASWPEEPAAASEWSAPSLPALDAAQQAAVDHALDAVRLRGGYAARLIADEPAVEVDLGLVGRGIVDSDLDLLRGLEPVLVRLDLSRASLTDDVLTRLAGFPHLRRLDLSRTGIGDAGLPHLVVFAELEQLNLYGTPVTDAGLDVLQRLPRLRKVFLWQTEATDAGIARLQEALPQLEIVRGGLAERLVELERSRGPARERVR